MTPNGTVPAAEEVAARNLLSGAKFVPQGRERPNQLCLTREVCGGLILERGGQAPEIWTDRPAAS